ncbi:MULTISPECIES: hypothetical protein [unclassified Microcoleus]|uniref:hypothetical protein n=1 Tax=unclassified Microcoleus TaxID=2642155 RepID=UPI002FD6B5DA
MKAESEVSISFAISIFLDKEFTPDDDTLNYESYKKLGLTCGKCRELIFFKPCIERVSHFSHFNETGKGCEWKTKNNTNTRKQDTDSESREQSLEKFQNKFKGIIEGAIIQYQKISSSQLLSQQIEEGKRLVAEYNINIEAWLRWFNGKINRKYVQNVAVSLYQNNELLSDENSRVLLNLVDYLCVSASEDVLRYLLYYVVFLLNKEIAVNKDVEEVCSKVIEIISFADWEKEYKRAKELVARQRPKPIKLDGAKVAQGTVIFRSVVGTTPLLACLVPSGKEWKLIGLPVKVPEYDLARYVVGNLSPNQAIAYLHREIDRLKNQNKVNSLKLIARLENLLIQVVKGKKLNPESLRESTVIIRKYLDKAEFKHNSLYTDNYYRSHTLGDVSFIQELETKKLTYTFIWGSENATRQSEVPSVIKWLKRVPTSLGKKFPFTFPSFEEIRDYVRSIFKFENVELIIKEERGIYIEIYYEGRLQARQRLDITSPIAKDRIGGQVPTKVSTSIQYVGDGEFYSLLRCTSADRQLVREAKSQLEKIVQKFLAANPARFTVQNKVSMPTSVADICGFGSTSKGINQVIKTFKKFVTPFTIHSEVDQGKLINLLTLETYNEHDANELLDSLIRGWKYWEKSKDEKIELGGQLFHNPDPGKLMLGVHNLLDEQPHLDTLVWGDLIDVFYQLSGLSIGFKCSKGVVLTPWTLYTDDVSRWEHRIKIQLLSILKDGDNTRTLGIQALLQQDIKSFKKTLDKMQPGWLSNNAHISKHLEALEDCLRTAKKLRGQD